MHKNVMKCNKTQRKWCINKHGASKIVDTFETYQQAQYFCHVIFTRNKGRQEEEIFLGRAQFCPPQVDPVDISLARPQSAPHVAPPSHAAGNKVEAHMAVAAASVITATARVGVDSLEIKMSIPQRAYRLWFQNAPCNYSPKYA
jgi:hypothetical protein